MTLLPRYLRNLGLLEGFKVFMQVEVLKRERVTLKKYPHPLYLRRGSTDFKVFREIFLFNQYGFSVDENPKVIVDAGANIGLSTVYLKNRFRDAVIYAIEPDQANFQMLLRQIAPWDGITPIQSGIWNSDSFLRVRDTAADAWALEVETCNEGDKGAFKAISIQGLMRQYGLGRIDLLKIDIEGSERELFMDAYEHWLPRTKVIVIEFHDWMKEGCSRAVFKAIAQYRFKTIVFEGMLVFINLEPAV